MTLNLHSHSSTTNHTGSRLLEKHHLLKNFTSFAPVPSPEDEEDLDGPEEKERQRLTAKLFGRIEEDFEPWKDGITLDMVERLYCTVSICHT